MTQPLSLDTVLSEFGEDYKAWVLQSGKGGEYLVIPDPRYPGRRPIRFFMSKADADRVLLLVLEAKPELAGHHIVPVQVNLHRALRGIATDKTRGNADSFVVHSPNEVFDFIRTQ
jgi:hypothetical protein